MPTGRGSVGCRDCCLVTGRSNRPDRIEIDVEATVNGEYPTSTSFNFEVAVQVDQFSAKISCPRLLVFDHERNVCANLYFALIVLEHSGLVANVHVGISFHCVLSFVFGSSELLEI